MFGIGRSSKGGVVGRAAKPGEVVNRKATPVTDPKPNATRAKGRPRRSK
jgi:hypothetical protein